MNDHQWWGGFYERLFGVVKSCLKKNIAKQKLTYDELTAVLVQIEYTINSRPLTYVSDDSNDEVLTPHHLIYGRSLNDKCFLQDYDSKTFTVDDVQNTRNHVKTVIQHFMKRFEDEYLLALQERHSYQQNKYNNVNSLRLNDIVLVKEDNKARLSWRKGRVIKLLIGNDKRIRGAELRVYQKGIEKTTNIRRPLQHLVPLEIHNHDITDSSITTYSFLDRTRFIKTTSNGRPKC